MCSKNTDFLTENQLKSPAKKHFHKELPKNSKKNLYLEHFQKVQHILGGDVRGCVGVYF